MCSNREYFIFNNYLTNLFREWRAQKDHPALEGYQDRDYLDQRLGNFLKSYCAVFTVMFPDKEMVCLYPYAY